jgi:hypothetical protein
MQVIMNLIEGNMFLNLQSIIIYGVLRYYSSIPWGVQVLHKLIQCVIVL